MASLGGERKRPLIGGLKRGVEEVPVKCHAWDTLRDRGGGWGGVKRGTYRLEVQGEGVCCPRLVLYGYGEDPQCWSGKLQSQNRTV